MRSKFTLLLLALNLALFGYLALTERWLAPDQVEENRRRVLGPEAADLSAIEISTFSTGSDTAAASPAQIVRLKRESKGNTWSITTPLDWPANDFAVRQILNQLQFLENETSFLVSDLARNGQTLADYGLERPRIVVTCTPAAQALGQSMIDKTSDTSPSEPASFVLKIGATAAVGDRLYILPPDGKRIHVIDPKRSSALVSALTLDLAQLRSDQLFTIPVFEARALTLQSGAANSARTRLRREQSRWIFEAPITARAAKTPVELAVNDLNALRVARFLPPDSAPAPETTGLANPRLRVTLEGNARRETLLLGAAVPGASPVDKDNTRERDETVELYARLDWRATPSASPAAEGKRADAVLFTVRLPSKLLETLGQAQTALRDKRILDLDPARVTAFALSAPLLPELRIQKLESGPGGGAAAWQIAAPAVASPLRADPLLVERLLQRLQLLEAVSPRPHDKPPASPFVADAPSAAELEKLGFNRPERVVTLQLAAANANGPASATTEVVLELAQPGGSDPALYARVAGQPFIYSVPPDTLEQIPVAPIVYRDRALARIPEATKITRLVIRRSGTPEAAPLLDYVPGSEPPSAPVATVLAALRELRAKSIDREDYTATTLVDGVEKPWAYTLEATLDPAPASGPLKLSLAERSGGSTQLAGSEALGLVFTLEQPVLDALWQILYREPKP